MVDSFPYIGAEIFLLHLRGYFLRSPHQKEGCMYLTATMKKEKKNKLMLHVQIVKNKLLVVQMLKIVPC